MIPDYFEALTGYRAFGVFRNGLLVGQAHTEPWPPYQPFVARCGDAGYGFSHHILDGAFIAPPVQQCTCGIYALKNRAEAKLRMLSSDLSLQRFGPHGSPNPEFSCWGSVSLWGRVIEHERGYRAEYAYPSELWMTDATTARRVQSLYGIPCHYIVEGEELITDKDMAAVLHNLPPIMQGFIRAALHRNNVAFQTQAYGRMNRGHSYGPAAYPLFNPNQTYGQILSVGQDFSSSPMVHQPRPLTIKPQLVGATPFQIRQYAKLHNPGHITIPDWRSILRRMIYAK